MPQKAQSPQEAPGKEPEARRRLTALEIYAGWTALIVVVALVATVLLGRQPRVQAANVPLPQGWAVVSDHGRTFTVFLPQEWEQLDAAAEDEGRRLQQLLDDTPVYRRATEPLSGFVEDGEVLFLSRGSRVTERAGSGAFLLVMRSSLLNRLTPTEAVGLAHEGDLVVRDARQVLDYEKSHVALRVELPGTGAEGVTCRQQFTTGERYGLLLTLCSTSGQLASDTIDTILGSAQRLAP